MRPQSRGKHRRLRPAARRIRCPPRHPPAPTGKQPPRIHMNTSVTGPRSRPLQRVVLVSRPKHPAARPCARLRPNGNKSNPCHLAGSRSWGGPDRPPFDWPSEMGCDRHVHRRVRAIANPQPMCCRDARTGPILGETARVMDPRSVSRLGRARLAAVARLQGDEQFAQQRVERLSLAG